MNLQESRREPLFNVPAIVVAAVVVMVAVQVVRANLSPEDEFELMALFAFVPDRYVPAGEARFPWPGGPAADVWTFFTYAFLHGDWVHLAVNAPFLVAFGSVVARRFGTLRFSAFALVCTAAAAAAHLMAHFSTGIPVVGASGAISGLMGAVLRFGFVPGGPMAADSLGRSRLPEDQYRAAQLPAWSWRESLADRRVQRFLLAFVVMNLALVFAGPAFTGSDTQIAWEAHVGGFLAGFVLFGAFDPVPRRGA